MRFTTSLLSWGKVSWLCAGILLKFYWFDNLGFFLRENLLLHSSYLPLGVSQRTCDLHVSSTFSGAVAGEKRRSCLATPVNIILPGAPATIFSGTKLLQGESHTYNLFTLLLSCLVYFYFALFVSFIKNQKIGRASCRERV